MMAMLAALGAGYLGSKEKERSNRREDEKDQREKEVHDAKMEEYRKTKADQAAVADTYGATPTDAYTQGQGQELEAIANAKDAQGKPYYAVGNDPTGKYTVTPNFQNETGAQPQAYAPATIAANGVNYLDKRYDQPLTDEQAMGARRTRIADLAAQGSAAASTALDREQKTVKFDQEQQDRVKLLQKEGVFDAAAAMRRGDAAGVAEAFNRSGEHKIIGDVTVAPEKRTIPNHGDIDTFTYTFDLQGPDGKVQRVSRNSFDISQAIMPYEKQIEAMRAGKKDAADIANKEAQTEEHKARANYWNNGGAPGAKASAGQGGGSDKPFKMDEDDKIRVKEAAASVRDAEKMLNEALRTAQPGDPAHTNALAVLKRAKLEQLSTHIETGLMTPEKMVDQVYASALSKNGRGDQDVMKSLSELASINGEFSETIAQMVHSDPRWKSLPKTGAYPPPPRDKTPAVPTQAPAPTTPAAAARNGVAATTPTYAAWIAAKTEKDELIAVANKMTPDRREMYLRSRLPQIEQAIQFNQNYRTY